MAVARWPGLPLPPELKSTGRSRAMATSSRRDRTPTEGCAPKSSPEEAITTRGLRSCVEKGSRPYSEGLIVNVVSIPLRMVWPSAAALATSAAATLPPAPALLSTTTACPRALLIFSASRREAMSEGPPGGNELTMRMVLDGKAVWADAAAPMSASAVNAATPRRKGRICFM